MKKIHLSELKKQIFLTEKEALSIEHNGKLIGYFYPINDQQTVENAIDKLEKTLDKIREETGWNEEELVTAFMNTELEKCN